MWVKSETKHEFEAYTPWRSPKRENKILSTCHRFHGKKNHWMQRQKTKWMIERERSQNSFFCFVLIRRVDRPTVVLSSSSSLSFSCCCFVFDLAFKPISCVSAKAQEKKHCRVLSSCIWHPLSKISKSRVALGLIDRSIISRNHGVRTCRENKDQLATDVFYQFS